MPGWNERFSKVAAGLCQAGSELLEDVSDRIVLVVAVVEVRPADSEETPGCVMACRANDYADVHEALAFVTKRAKERMEKESAAELLRRARLLDQPAREA